MTILYIYTNFVNLNLCKYHELPKERIKERPSEGRSSLGTCYRGTADCMATAISCASSPGRSSRHMMISRPS